MSRAIFSIEGNRQRLDGSAAIDSRVLHEGGGREGVAREPGKFSAVEKIDHLNWQ